MQRQIIPKLLLIGLLVSSTVVLAASWGFHNSGQSKKESQESIKEKYRNQFPIADSSEPESPDPRERTKRLKRNKKYNEKLVKVGPELVQSSDGYEWPADFKAIPTSTSDAVIIGTICDAKAHLSEDKNSVYSEFTVTINDILKNNTGLSL